MESILDRPPPEADERLSYGGEPSQFGDLRLPRVAGPHPLVIALHGGFWRDRYDLSHLGHLCAALTEAGGATFNLEYRRLGEPGGGYPGTCDDALAGARFALRLPGIDASRAVLIGHSAGGHLALWAAKALPVRGVVALAAVSDLKRAAELRLSDGVAAEFVGEAPIGAANSPIERLPLRLPQTLIHGTMDDVVPLAMSEAYVARATAAGDAAKLVALPGVDHYALIDPFSDVFTAVRDAVRALTNA